MRNENFKKLLEKSTRVTDKAITKIINKQLDTRLAQFTQEKYFVELRKIKKKEICWSWWKDSFRKIDLQNHWFWLSVES